MLWIIGKLNGFEVKLITILGSFLWLYDLDHPEPLAALLQLGVISTSFMAYLKHPFQPPKSFSAHAELHLF